MDTATKNIMDTATIELERIFNLQKSNQIIYGNEPIKKRYDRLTLLQKAIENNRQALRDALYADFKKPSLEVDASEILPLISEIKHAKRNLTSWTRNRSVKTPLSLLGSSSKIINEPKGVSLIIAPWNFPVFLTLVPLVSAIAAGCPAMLKPSEITPHTSALLQKIINETFDEKEVALVQGGVKTSSDLLELPFNHIHFTGAPAIGKIVMKAASKHLTSVTLELGGKSPVIVDETANLKIAAKRIVWSKFMNSGQICVAPDYLIVHESVKNQLLTLIKENIKQFFTENPSESDSYTRIVNRRHFDRLNNYLKDAIENGGKFELGGKVDANTNFIEPSIVSNLDSKALLLKEEIFGPILPIIEFSDIQKVPGIIEKAEKPLALYIYSKSKKNINYLMSNTRAGGTAINHSIIHLFNSNLPFGGINNSGIGKSMGYYGYLEFVNQRGVLKQFISLSASDLLLPPYDKTKTWLVKLTEKWLS